MTDHDFKADAQVLANPRMGTEAMAPLLYDLVRFTRPRRCLEIGMGYTSLFLLQALADNAADDRRDGHLLAGKASILGFDPTTPGIEQLRQMAKAPKGEKLDWLESEPSLADPTYYDRIESGRLIAIDDLSSPNTGANIVREIAEKRGISSFLQLENGDFRGLAAKLVESHGLFDFVWFDCGGLPEYRDFFTEYWSTISGNGGLLLLHYTLTNTSMGYFRQQLELKIARGELGKSEIISFREPHKMMQNSFTIIRKISDDCDKIYPEVRDISLERD